MGWKKILLMSLVGLLAVGLVGGAAFAFTRSGDGSCEGKSKEERVGEKVIERRGNIMDVRREVTEEAAAALGMSADELQQQVRDGRTVKEIAEEKGVPVDSVVESVTRKLEELIDEKASEMKSNVEDKVRRFIEEGKGAFHGGQGEEGSRDGGCDGSCE